MITMSEHPRCRGYLLAMERRALENEAMTPWFAAVILADAWDDEVLAESGLVNFWTMDGNQLLEGFEALLARGGDKRLPRGGEPSDRLRAFLGSRGVKTSALRPDDYFHVCEVLWGITRDTVKTLDGLERAIAGMTKAERKRANANIRLVPVKFLSGSEALQ